MMKENQDNFIKNMKGREISLKEYYVVVKKRLWLIALITVITTVAAYFYSNWHNTPLYQTSTRVVIDSDSGNMKTLMVMIKDPIIMENVKNELQLTRSADQLAEQIGVEQLDESQVVKISVTDDNPEMAVQIANTTAETFKREIVHILNFRDVQLLSDAKENPYPINSTQNRTIIIAVIFGVITGIGLVFLLDSLDGKIREEREAEDILGAPVLGFVSNMTKKKATKKKVKKREQVVALGGEAVDLKKKKAEGY
ncbi:Wzz/FepE/Etk N-terminal domain-containing protein [Lentibacillus sp. N15]|uniref:YveK family protein n=1 Tax=Lentibacillus songyuanensis TaxID=3136161 RepID=UPI0031B9C8A8